MDNALKVGEVFGSAWQKFKLVWWKLAIAFAILSLAQILIEDAFDDSAIFFILSTIISIIYCYVTVRLGLMAVRGEVIDWKTGFAVNWKHVLFIALASIITMVLTLLGLVLLIVPGIIIGLRLGFSSYFIVDEKLKPIDAVKATWALTKGHVWKLFCIAAIVAVVAILAALVTMGLGMIIVAPFIALLYADLYQRLKNFSLPVAEVKA